MSAAALARKLFDLGASAEMIVAALEELERTINDKEA